MVWWKERSCPPCAFSGSAAGDLLLDDILPDRRKVQNEQSKTSRNKAGTLAWVEQGERTLPCACRELKPDVQFTAQRNTSSLC